MTTVTRPALLSALRYLMQAAGITPEELLARPMLVSPVVEMTAIQPAPAPISHAPAPIHPPLIANSWPKRPPTQRQRKLTPQAEHVLTLADRADGITVADVMAELDIKEPTAHRHCQRLTDELRLLTRVKAPGDRAHRFFARPAQSAAYFEAAKTSQQRDAAPETVQADPEPPRAVLSEAEHKALRIKLAKQAGARKAPPPLGPRTTRKAPGKTGAELVVQGGTVSPPAPAMPKPAAAPIITEATRRTIDNTKRPNARHEAGPPLPPDPRWPSFASAPLGVNPDTGRPWA